MPETAVAFFVYNRLETTARVFERIAAARPSRLLVVADGPRADRPNDDKRCNEVRTLVCHPTWPCQLELNLAPVNLGFRQRFSSGLAWAFSQQDELIVLEDDCLPDPTFFPFCGEMLAHYRNDSRVMMITGSNFQFGRRRGFASYYASQCVGTWGWATWRRAFRHFDADMTSWPSKAAAADVARIWPVAEAAAYWQARFDETKRGEVDTWDYQWALAMWRRGGLQLAPNGNLVEYIGCLPDTTHTRQTHAPYCRVPTVPLSFPLQHLGQLERDVQADLFEFYRVSLLLEEDEADRKSHDATR